MRDRIPFATANLETACTAVRSNLGVMAVALLGLLAGFLWTFWWVLTYLAVSYAASENANGEDDIAAINGGATFALLLMFYWLHQVLSNIVHVTVAGAIGTWWFNPPLAASCCSPAVTSSAGRATTHSLGSICFGSLLVALIQTLRAVVEQARMSDDGIIVCLADCILGCIQSVAEYFNKCECVRVERGGRSGEGVR